MGNLTPELEKIRRTLWQNYCRMVLEDFSGLKKEYPFSYLLIQPTAEPSLALASVTAVNRNIIEAVNGRPEDFQGEFSKLIHLEIPLDSRSSGCLVYGGKWIDERKIPAKDMHLFHSNKQLVENRFGYKMCVGTPESFSSMKNVLLEAVKTADNMLVAYERVQSGTSDRVILNAYSHGDIGRKEYQNDRKRYVSR